MAWFRVVYLTQLGGMEVMNVEAEDRDQAMVTAGVPRSTIQQVSIDHLGGIKAQLTEKRLPLIDQALALSALASKLSSGKTIGKAVLESVDVKRLGLSQQHLDSCQSPREYLARLRFDDTAVLLAEAGDKSGQLSESLEKASDAIIERLNAAKEFGKTLKQGIMYSCLGLLFMVGIPLFAGGQLRDFVEVHRIPLLMNEFSHLILFLRGLYTDYALIFLGAAVGGFVFREQLWERARRLPGLRFINERMKVKRALDFVTSYQLLQSSGFPTLLSFKFLLQRSKGRTHRLYEEALRRLEEGRDLADIFNTDEWPPLLNQNLQGFDGQSPEGREKVLENLGKALKTYYIQYSEKISSTASLIGFSMMMLTIIMFAVGFYLPIINISSALKAQ
jgi:type II secretory pathway component PulF